MVEQHFGKVQIQVQFLVGAPIRALVKWISSLASNEKLWVRFLQARPNKYAPVDKLVKSALSKGAVFSVRIGAGVPKIYFGIHQKFTLVFTVNFLPD